MKHPSNSIAVICSHSTMTKRVLLGTAAFFRRYDNWNIAPFEKMDDVLSISTEGNFMGAIIVNDGVLPFDKINQLIKTFPVVGIGCENSNQSIPILSINLASIAKLAATALLDRGFQSVGFVGEMNLTSSKSLQMTFCDELRSHGIAPFIFTCHPHVSESNLVDSQQLVMRRRLITWLESLPKETGIFAANDFLAFEVYKAACQLKRVVPDEFALIGVNDDDLFCKIMNPSLSSVRLPFEKMGFDAAKMIRESIPGGIEVRKKVNSAPIVYEPMGLISRGSTKTVVAKDPIVKAAVNFIHENFMEPINIENVLEELNVSRSLLERRFRDELGVTPLVELRRQRIEKARALLSDTNESIHDMGRRCGFSSAIRFTTVFKEQVGMTPTEFRKQMVPISSK